MALDDDISVLSRAPLFSLLERDALRLLSFAAEHRALKAEDVLFRKGDRSDGGYVVTHGAIALETRPGSFTPFVAGPSALIGQTALFVRQRRPATATAREPSGVIRISPTLMRRVLQEFPAATHALHRALSLDLADLAGSLDEVRQHLLEGGTAAAP